MIYNSRWTKYFFLHSAHFFKSLNKKIASLRWNLQLQFALLIFAKWFKKCSYIKYNVNWSKKLPKDYTCQWDNSICQFACEIYLNNRNAGCLASKPALYSYSSQDVPHMCKNSTRLLNIFFRPVTAGFLCDRKLYLSGFYTRARNEEAVR